MTGGGARQVGLGLVEQPFDCRRQAGQLKPQWLIRVGVAGVVDVVGIATRLFLDFGSAGMLKAGGENL